MWTFNQTHLATLWKHVLSWGVEYIRNKSEYETIERRRHWGGKKRKTITNKFNMVIRDSLGKFYCTILVFCSKYHCTRKSEDASILMFMGLRLTRTSTKETSKFIHYYNNIIIFFSWYFFAVLYALIFSKRFKWHYVDTASGNVKLYCFVLIANFGTFTLNLQFF